MLASRAPNSRVLVQNDLEAFFGEQIGFDIFIGHHLSGARLLFQQSHFAH
jgi:hypothetical protein